MAIFGKEDRNVPLPNQFYQLRIDADDPEGGELNQWVSEWAARQLGTPVGLFEPKSDPESVQSFASLHQMYVRIMDSMADNGDLNHNDEDGLNGRLSLLRPHIVRGKDNAWTLGWQPLNSSGGIFNLRPLLEPLLVIQLAQALERPQSFRRCESCHNAFIAPRGGRYCSHRCIERAGERRRRKMKTLGLTKSGESATV